MDVTLPSSSTAGGTGGPAFLLKNMVDDSSTDEIVSWSSTNTSFMEKYGPKGQGKTLNAATASLAKIANKCQKLIFMWVNIFNTHILWSA